MANDLDKALQEIDGVGPVTAEKILDVIKDVHLDGHDTRIVSDEVVAQLEAALDYADAGNPGYAMKFVRQALDSL